MNPDRWSRIKTLFAAASELPTAERAAYLERETSGDQDLLAEVHSLLSSHDSAAGFLQPLPGGLRAQALDAAGGTGIGERIGPYRLVEVIGTGGMGDVYKAVRNDDEYRAEVAIKIMRADVRNPLAERRFKSERQILAALDHRNIARLLDGGTTPNGLPYVVMELISGEPIDRYCEAHSLDTRARVNLFLQVCSAVSYAHQHLVVHRDLKPNNIFVTADGSVKLLDFGIAKLLEADAVTGTPTEETRTQFRAMTLEYASPEQVSGGNVNTVSDVYSLGVVLYRLLTGQSPYRATGGDAARVAEILGETTPTRPSAVATQDRRVIDADLDHILLMALRKEPAKRYGSVEQFAADLRNYLGGRPVGARRGTLAYRSGKFIRRHKIPIAAAVLIVLSLVTGLSLAIREAHIARQERATAQRHFNSVRTLATKLFDFHDEIEKLQGATRAREMLLKTSLEYLDALYAEGGSDLALQEELARAYGRVGAIQGSPSGGNTGDMPGSVKSFQRAAELAEGLHAANPKDYRATAMLAEIYSRLTHSLAYMDGAEASQEPARLAVKYADEAAPHLEDAADRTKLLVSAYWAGAVALAQAERRGEALALCDRMVAIAEDYTAAHPEEARGLEMVNVAYSNAGIITDETLPAEKTAQRAQNLVLKAIAVGEKLVAMEPTQVSRQWSLAEDRFNLGNIYLSTNRYREALRQFELAAPVLKARAAPGSDAQANLTSLMTTSHLGWTQFQLGRVDDAQRALTEAVRDLESVAASYANLQAKYTLGVAQIRLGAVHASRHDWPTARPLLLAGVKAVQEVDEEFKLDGADRLELDLGLDLLAKNP